MKLGKSKKASGNDDEVNVESFLYTFRREQVDSFTCSSVNHQFYSCTTCTSYRSFLLNYLVQSGITAPYLVFPRYLTAFKAVVT